MNYFYAYIPDHKQQDAILQSVHLSEKQVYIDENREDKNWKDLLSKIKKEDTVFIPSIEMLSFDEEELKNKLETVKNRKIQLTCLDKKTIDATLLLELIEFLNFSRRNKARELQRVGIEKALEKKYKGEGRFGRPRVVRPDDFEYQLDRIFNKELTHESYREELGMKRSTYYKLVHEYKLKLEKEEGKS
ncbi:MULTISPECIES: hypothetical protein [unclassified Amedibacterium]|uniref:hypothetical protein n=1 Tax=unclassified Amedibacterium TaxID=3088137 RepID=UPI000E3F16B3|nr:MULTISPECIES: hypothetical protein [unclassified Absiella]RGB65540.1 hypothetical protein DW113_12040 [Absiella sp. AM09-45]RGB74526.1 hypothetical protein DW114_13725 [Absiella sp. AM09-50]RGC53193.1 hypothetical protein DW761_02230 [Absiella sp. AM29-15]